MRRVPQVTLILLGVACSGCVAFGDGLLTVKGELTLTDSRAIACTLSLANLDEKEPRPYNVRPITGKYFADFTVAPTARDYRIIVSCIGYDSVERTIHFMPPVTRIDLEAISPPLKKGK